MKRVWTILLLGVFLLIAGAGCNPVRKITTDVLEPAKIAFPDDVFSVGYLMDEPRLVVNTRTNREAKVDARQQFWTGLMDLAVNSPRFNPRSLQLIEYSNDSLPQDTLDWKQVEHITDSLDLDALAVFHEFTFSDSLDRKVVYEFENSAYYFIYKVNAKMLWRIYEPRKRRIISEYTYEEQYVWESASPDEREAIRNLVDLDRAYRLSAYWAGYDSGQILFPYWEEKNRFYYVRGSRNFRQAKDYVEEKNWPKAIELWKKSFNRGSKELARRAAFNIAFACEMMGKIDLALEWANRAQEIQYMPRVEEYLQTLRERRQKLDKLDEQMPI